MYWWAHYRPKLLAKGDFWLLSHWESWGGKKSSYLIKLLLPREGTPGEKKNIIIMEENALPQLTDHHMSRHMPTNPEDHFKHDFGATVMTMVWHSTIFLGTVGRQQEQLKLCKGLREEGNVEHLCSRTPSCRYMAKTGDTLWQAGLHCTLGCPAFA